MTTHRHTYEKPCIVARERLEGLLVPDAITSAGSDAADV
jgi:hypothetical protein